MEVDRGVDGNRWKSTDVDRRLLKVVKYIVFAEARAILYGSVWKLVEVIGSRCKSVRKLVEIGGGCGCGSIWKLKKIGGCRYGSSWKSMEVGGGPWMK